MGHGAIVHGARIEDNCIIGMHSTVMNNAVVGTGSIIGAGALVTQDTIIPSSSLVVGVPGKVVKQDKQLLSIIQRNAQSYQKLTQEYKQGKFPDSPH
jgi:carbonic anhydrase/acetyltransferase-like protein (isoleucine patch superfamily)